MEEAELFQLWNVFIEFSAWEKQDQERRARRGECDSQLEKRDSSNAPSWCSYEFEYSNESKNNGDDLYLLINKYINMFFHSICPANPQHFIKLTYWFQYFECWTFPENIPYFWIFCATANWWPPTLSGPSALPDCLTTTHSQLGLNFSLQSCYLPSLDFLHSFCLPSGLCSPHSFSNTKYHLLEWCHMQILVTQNHPLPLALTSCISNIVSVFHFTGISSWMFSIASSLSLLSYAHVKALTLSVSIICLFHAHNKVTETSRGKTKTFSWNKWFSFNYHKPEQHLIMPSNTFEFLQ